MIDKIAGFGDKLLASNITKEEYTKILVEISSYLKDKYNALDEIENMEKNITNSKNTISLQTESAKQLKAKIELNEIERTAIKKQML